MMPDGVGVSCASGVTLRLQGCRLPCLPGMIAERTPAFLRAAQCSTERPLWSVSSRAPAALACWQQVAAMPATPRELNSSGLSCADHGIFGCCGQALPGQKKRPTITVRSGQVWQTANDKAAFAKSI